MVLYTDDVQRILYQLLLDQSIELAFMLDLAVYAFEAFIIGNVWNGKRDFESNCLIVPVLIEVETLYYVPFGLIAQPHKNYVKSHCIEQDQDDQGYGNYLFQVVSSIHR